MTKKVFRRAGELACAAAAGVCVVIGLTKRTQDQPDVLAIEQIQDLSSLMTTQIQVADVQETQLSGFSGGARAIGDRWTTQRGLDATNTKAPWREGASVVAGAGFEPATFGL